MRGNDDKRTIFGVALPAGFVVSGVILADQGKSLDWPSRNATFVAALPGAVVAEVLLKLNTLLDPQP